MSARKLQQEFDKTNKKISEGLSDFDEIYEKLTSGDVGSQKEKLESDLKKEIKKLQRSRDQLKSWLSDSSIKLDKNLLQENRTKIERAMDQFKDLEKSSKIKQFSNEGLELQSQKQGRFTRPEDAKKAEASQYISDIIEQINQQNETLEAEVHQITLSLKKAKSSQQSQLQTALDDGKYKIERNISHLTNLERILRNLENENLDPEKIEDIKDDLEYYVDNNQEDDYVEYDDFYDVLEMSDDIVDQVQGSLLVDKDGKTNVGESSELTSSAGDEHESTHISTKSTIHSSDKKPANNVVTPKKMSSVANNNATSTTSSSAPGSASASTANGTPGKSFVSNNNPPPIASYTNLIKSAHAKASPPGLLNEKTMTKDSPISNSSASVAKANKAETPNTPVGKNNSVQVQHDSSSVGQTADSKTKQEGSSENNPNVYTSTNGPGQASDSAGQTVMSLEGKSLLDTIPRFSTIPQSRLENPLPFQSINPLLEQSLLNCPDSFDAEKPRQYHPVNTHPSSVDFPQEPMYELNSSNMMKKFDNDTLFFCFYYSVGNDNIARWNAAKELSNRGWAFHTELKQWFQKDKLTKEGEENYKYFDYEKTWLTRRRENFNFAPESKETFV